MGAGTHEKLHRKMETLLASLRPEGVAAPAGKSSCSLVKRRSTSVARFHAESSPRDANAFLPLNFVDWMALCPVCPSFEAAGGAAIERPAGVEGWLPIAALMN